MDKPTIKAVIFDFDGVILESANIKTEAFLELYDAYPEHLAAIKKHHLENQGISRFEKFKWIAWHLFQQEITDEESRELGNRFSALVLQKVLSAPFVPGTPDFLTFLFNHNIPAFVASGTPEVELQDIVTKRELGKWFMEVHGAPRKKPVIVADILHRYQIKAEQVLFIGDATTDHQAAQAAGTHFFGRWTEELADYWHQTDELVRNDLTDIVSLYEWS